MYFGITFLSSRSTYVLVSQANGMILNRQLDVLRMRFHLGLTYLFNCILVDGRRLHLRTVRLVAKHETMLDYARPSCVQSSTFSILGNCILG